VEEIKKSFFEELDGYVRKDTIIATNSSRLVNLHCFNPALVMKLVEVVQDEHCSDETIAAVMEFCTKTNKSPIHLRKENDGFVVNRILRAIETEAWYLISEGICSTLEVDMAASWVSTTRWNVPSV